jgi:putative nucleotidyltransferase with HDIG domain
MHLSTYAPRLFSEGDVRLLTAIADMAASAIHRAGLFEQLEHRVRELSALFDMSKMVTASLRIEDVLAFVVSAAAQAAHAEGCYLFLWDEREKRLALRASQGFLAGEVGRLKYRLGEGLAGWVFLEGRTVNVPDLAADPRWKRNPEHEAPLPAGRAIGALIVPLVVGDKVLGVLGVVNKTGAPAFTPNDELLLPALAGQVAIAIENARLYGDVRSLSIAAIRSLATAIDARDPYTRSHSADVTRLAVQLARELGWSGADLEILEFAALLHDVGKIAVPDAILRKIEPLTSDEWNVIRLHPYYSAQIVKPVEPLQRIIPWLYHHQERWDGTGYPDGLKGEAIPLAARIIAVADAFNAMTTDRPYRKARSVAEALEEIDHCAGRQFDPMIAKVFLKMAREAG